ncbi:Solute carrier 13 [Porites harrisoni]
MATPPNAIIFAYGHLKVKDMAKAGIVMNVLAVTVLIICVNTYGVPMFDLKTFPDWAGNAAKTGGGPGTSSNVKLVCHNVTTAIANLTSS